MLLGDIDELEIDREGADQTDGFIEAEAAEQFLESSFGRRRMVLSQLLAQRAHALFRLEQPLAAEPFQGFAQQIAEAMNVGAERRVPGMCGKFFQFAHRALLKHAAVRSGRAEGARTGRRKRQAGSEVDGISHD